ncbi:MAG: NAD(P)H-hydrate dehydratase [Lachnospiraceae bacterium]|jgi:NAD(P)H-hydrate epimerase|nr:NAD(P)H-hydrate dehydratase [Lachnospiraceae bacterium]
MRILVSGRLMKQIDRHAIEHTGIPSLVLMERAALAVADVIERGCGASSQDTPHGSGRRVRSRPGRRCVAPRRILVACGNGNNGADGIAIARILYGHGYDVSLSYLDDSATPATKQTPAPSHTQEWALQRGIADKLGIPVVGRRELYDTGWDVLVDAVFGVGVNREVAGDAAEYLHILDKLPRGQTVAVDMPSGINADDGQVMGVALGADVTVTFGYEKLGTALFPGKGYAGTVVVADIGFFAEKMLQAGADEAVMPQGPSVCGKPSGRPSPYGMGEPPRGFGASDGMVSHVAPANASGWGAGIDLALCMELADLSRVPTRRADGNKGTFGKVLVVAGSPGMAGAACMSARAAYRTGAGLVKIYADPQNREILQTLIPEAIVVTGEEGGLETCGRPGDRAGHGSIVVTGEEGGLETACDWADVIVCGPGLGQGESAAKKVETVLRRAAGRAPGTVSVVLDADGLNILAKDDILFQYIGPHVVMTPHVGEMARLTGKSVEALKADPMGAAAALAQKTDAVCVLKDAVTVVTGAHGRPYVNASGSSALAKAGSGDVLTGVLAGLVALGGGGQSTRAWHGDIARGAGAAADGIGQREHEEDEAAACAAGGSSDDMASRLAQTAALGVYIHGLAGEELKKEKGAHGAIAGEIADKIPYVMRRCGR